jgi:hypothetical protein
MIVYYEGSIRERLLDAIYEAKRLNKNIEQIALDDREGKEFEMYLKSLPLGANNTARQLANRIAQFYGVEVVW